MWISEGSEWIIDKVEGLYIKISNYEPLLGGSYISFPKALCGVMLDLLILQIVTKKE